MPAVLESMTIREERKEQKQEQKPKEKEDE
jgi:hypothetical protein